MEIPLVGVDTGGTFTDLVCVVDGRVRIHKEPSTPDNPAEAIVRGLTTLVGDVGAELVHGSTVATNALLERRGARVALVTTEGFEDLLRIGRQARPSIYEIDVEREPPLVASEDTHGAAERCGPEGEVLEPLSAAEIDRLRSAIRDSGVDAVAVCLLHSYANPEHERALAAALADVEGLFVCASSEVLPEFREYERASTTVVNAYVGPVMRRYLSDLEQRSGARSLRIMQSSGGALSVRDASEHAVHTILSGPAGGVVGAVGAAADAGVDRIISFDMGGTSTDVSLCPGRPQTTSDSSIAGLPVRVPVIDIHTVGAGGGSIAFLDPGGALKVGPRSAGAEPGPACYGRGGAEVTVTDANLVLGRLDPDAFLGGAAQLDAEAAHDAVAWLGQKAGLSPTRLAEGIVRIANITMEAAIRVISVERGHDPADFTLVSFGGAGGMHAAALAQSLGIATVLVPPAPGILSALGMLRADAHRDFSRSLLLSADRVTGAALEARFEELERLAAEDELLRSEGHRLRFERSLDLRYRGQGFELNVPWSEQFVEEFHRQHERRYGYADRARGLEIVTVRVRAVAPSGDRGKGGFAPAEQAGPAPTEHLMVFDGRTWEATRQGRGTILPGEPVPGPALISEYSATTVVPPGWRASVDERGNLLMERSS